MKEKNALPILPDDVIILILLMLPAKTIIRFRCVCKPWSDLPKNPDFIKKQAVENNKYNIFITTLSSHDSWPVPHYYRLDFDEASTSSLSDKAVNIDLPMCSRVQGKLGSCMGSCNGIFCFTEYILFNTVIVSLWNPSIQEFMEIVYKKPPITYMAAFGFGYDNKIDDYKLILIFSPQRCLIFNEPYAFSEIHVYTVGSSSWKLKGNTSCVWVYDSMKLLNGVMRWVAKKIVNHRAVATVIVSFDIAEKTTKEIQIPSCLLDERYTLRKERVVVVGKDLYFAVHVSEIFELCYGWWRIT